ncbi:protein modifying enzyme [Lithospermum erythrorhizon]|uniref:Selenoprotein O n=1 Tax=Lithospermum erythrorhizon TaxID=34254 RepID=A0AAV3S109_LITER
MDPPPPSAATSAAVDSLSDDLKSQSINSTIRLKLEELNWDNSFVTELPADPISDNIPREVLHACYTKVSPSAEVDNPQLVAWSESVAEILDLDPKEFEREDFPLKFSGASSLEGSIPYAQCYGGHQFGMWAGQLGDGRAITLGEVLNSKCERWELQLKGCGRTPYSRFADGLAVLRSSIREFLCSEAMHFLGIPTTRALCLVTTGKYVSRDMFYDGNPKDEPGAIVCRVAQSFLRFGSYQIHASRGDMDLEIVRNLANYTIKHHFPHLEKMNKSETVSFSTGNEDDSIVDLTSNKYAAWVVEVAERTASLVASWQGVGFTHGVLNTDNMSVLGLTIDYGPFGFLDAFDPRFTPNTTDLPGRRYCFANQPDIGLWNISQFATVLSAAQLINEKEANYAMERYGTKFMDEYQAIMTKKLGLPKYNKQLIGKLLNNMAVDKVDYTNFFRLLPNIKADPAIPEDELLIPLKAVLLDIGKERKEAWSNWVHSYIQELSTSGIPDEQRKASMDSVNPKYILRNYLCQSAIDAAEQGDFEVVRQLLKVMQCPYDDQPGMEKYARLPPAWAYRPGVCMLSCSS